MNKRSDSNFIQGFLLSYLFLLLSSTVSVCILYDKTRPEYYNNLWLLPMIFGGFVWAFTLIFRKTWSNLSTVAVIGIFSIRNVITPFIMFLGDYKGYFRFLSVENVNKGILLMLVESLILIVYTSFKINKVNHTPSLSSLDLNTNTTETALFFISLLIFVGVWVIRPDFFSGFKNVFSSTDIRVAEVEDSAKGILYTLFSFLFPLAYLNICLFLIKKINFGIISSKLIKTLLNLMVISIPLFFMNNSDGFTLICVTSLALIVYRIGGINKATFYIVIGGTLMTVFLYILLMVASMSFGAKNLTTLNQLSRAFQAYFPGVCNFAGFFNMRDYNKLDTLFYDVYSTIPFRNTIFGVQSDRRLVVLYTAQNAAPSHIIPCICQLFAYLSVLAPFVECLFIKGCIKSYEKTKRETSIYKLFNFYMLFIYFAMTPIMYNGTIFLTRCMQTIFPMMLLAAFFSRNQKQKTIEA